MASRALFNTQLTSAVKRAGARFQSTAASTSEFAAQREAVKAHAGRMYFLYLIPHLDPFNAINNTFYNSRC